jgi:N6-adenosine-specific RNA methylase IME4
MTAALVLPDPQSVTVAGIAELVVQAEAIRCVCRERDDAETARELHRRLEAFRKYVVDRTARAALERESRLTEILIGELIGPAVVGTNQHNGRGSKLEPLPKVDRNRFRTLFRNREQVEELLDRGITKRKALLDAIEAAQDEPAATPQNGKLRDHYPTIVIDPPWRYGNSATRGAAQDHYPTMSVSELRDLPLLCEPFGASVNSHLYLWTTAGFLREAFDLLDAWGYTYKTNLVWVKPQIGMGNYFRVSHEHVLFAVRGDAGRTQRKDLSSWFQAPRERHSSKPDVFYELVEAASPGPYLDIFARPRQTRLAGGDWNVWGNEV